MYVCPQKVLSIWTKSGLWVEADECYTMECHDPIQGQGHRSLKCAKMANFKSLVSSTSMHCNKRLMVNYDTPRQYLNFNQTDFCNWSLFGITWPSNLWCSSVPPSANEFYILWWVLYGAYFLFDGSYVSQFCRFILWHMHCTLSSESCPQIVTVQFRCSGRLCSR